MKKLGTPPEEPSMEEILAQIKGVIADDKATPQGQDFPVSRSSQAPIFPPRCRYYGYAFAFILGVVAGAVATTYESYRHDQDVAVQRANELVADPSSGPVVAELPVVMFSFTVPESKRPRYLKLRVALEVTNEADADLVRNNNLKLQALALQEAMKQAEAGGKMLESDMTAFSEAFLAAVREALPEVTVRGVLINEWLLGA